MSRPLRICLVASRAHPVAEPFAGGLEALTHTLARELTRRGHEVTLFAGAGSDAGVVRRLLPLAGFEASAAARADVNAPTERWLADQHAYLALMLDLAGPASRDFDVVHNNSLHHLPIALAPTVPVPVLTTLHTPPLAPLESALTLAPGSSSFTAVSEATARAWASWTPSTVVRNGVDLARWRVGPGGGPAVWSGRLVPEKAPHEAIDACRLAGQPLVLVGPCHDAAYLEQEVRPRLGPDAVYAGHLSHAELGRLLGRASVALTTPVWDEPYGLVAAEAMACGTPVAGYARGAVPEVVGLNGGVVARPGDVDDLADAVVRARRLDRVAVRRHAERTCSMERMVDGYERCYAALVRRDVAA